MEAPPQTKDVIIEPASRWPKINWRELLESYEIGYFFAWRDIKTRYKQSILGAAWAIFPPFAQMVIFSILFGNIAKVESAGLPYPVFVYPGLILWSYFSKVLANSSLSLVNQQALITKVYFPRMLVPIGTIGSPLLDYCIGLTLYFVILFYYGMSPSYWVFLLPALLVFTTFAALGLGFWLSALTVLYRDLKHILPTIIQLCMWISPVVYSVSQIPSSYVWIAALNPMTGLLEAHRAAILGSEVSFFVVAAGVALSALWLFYGAIMFKRLEERFVDLV